MSEPGPSVPPEPKPSPEVEMGIERLDKLIDLLLQIEYSASQDPYTEEAHVRRMFNKLLWFVITSMLA